MWNICFSSIPPCLHHWWAVNSRVRVLIALSCELVSACDRVRLLWRVWLLGVTLHTDSLRGLRTSETNTWPFCRTPRGKTCDIYLSITVKKDVGVQQRTDCCCCCPARDETSYIDGFHFSMLIFHWSKCLYFEESLVDCDIAELLFLCQLCSFVWLKNKIKKIIWSHEFPPSVRVTSMEICFDMGTCAFCLLWPSTTKGGCSEKQ